MSVRTKNSSRILTLNRTDIKERDIKADLLANKYKSNSRSSKEKLLRIPKECIPAKKEYQKLNHKRSLSSSVPKGRNMMNGTFDNRLNDSDRLLLNVVTGNN